MLEAREHLRLAAEPGLERTRHVGRRGHFEGDVTSEIAVLAQVDRPHPAPPDHADQAILGAVEIRLFRAAEASHHRVRERLHPGSTPKSSFASARYSSSLAVVSAS